VLYLVNASYIVEHWQPKIRVKNFTKYFPVSVKTAILIEAVSLCSLVFARYLVFEDEFWTCTLITSYRSSLAVEWSCDTEII
jgi:hypothetical protein